MWIFDEVAVERTLGIPYFREDPNSHSYVNLRDDPTKIDLLPELRDCAPLRNFVIALNAPTSPFETFGCEKWIGPWAHEAFPDYRFRQGCYVDLALLNKAACTTKTFYLQLIDAFRSHAAFHRGYDLMQVGFELRPTVCRNAGWWTMGVWIYGVGRTEAEAKSWWQEAVEYVNDFLLSESAQA